MTQPLIKYNNKLILITKHERTKNLLITLITLLLFFMVTVIFYVIIIKNANNINNKYNNNKITLDLNNINNVILEKDSELSRARIKNCSYWDCFNVYRCGQKFNDKITIYIYPLVNYYDTDNKKANKLTKEFYNILKIIINSEYYTPNPNDACIFIPSIDMLNQNNIDTNLIGKALASLPYWENGVNHLLFNFLSGSAPDFNTVIDVNTDRAIIAGAGFDTWTYRSGFDMLIPFYSPLLEVHKFPDFTDFNIKRKYLFISSQVNMFALHTRQLQEISYNSNEILLLKKCSIKPTMNVNKQIHNNLMYLDEYRCSFQTENEFAYPNVLLEGTFCLVARGARLGQPNLLESMAANCIPVIMADNIILPFEEIIDWSLASIKIRESSLHSVMDILKNVSNEKIYELRKQGHWLYNKYFSSLSNIILTLLDELNDRVFPHLAKNYLQWNMPPNPKATQNPLFLPLIAPKAQGFTAVILTYDRIDSLFILIQKLSIVPSLQKILIIWNNQRKSPPHPTMFPKINKPLKVIQTKANKLSNRFYPYEEIETEAILTIDDDIVMLTADELDFGYEVWREFPDRIVGFPSRTHVWDNITNRWRYESEWTNEISMVLTGAAFHHKYWSFMYTNAMPGDIKEWVDDHMNCEDIAMNFLVANITNKPPIKVAPRKKFKCPECTNNEMLSADLNHMLERSSCIDRFSRIYGTMPLKTVEFRADPVLYKDNFPEKLKRFNDIGSL